MASLRALAFGLAGVVLSASCGGSGGSQGGSTPSSPSPPPSGSSNIVTVTITGVNGARSFSPNPASCRDGQMVVFRNADIITHRVVLDDRSIDTGDIAPGASTQPLALAGVSKSYHCPLHPNMVGSLNEATTPEPPPCTGAYC
jgi:plastocyanin